MPQVVVFSLFGYAVVGSTPGGVPRPTRLPNTWEAVTFWRTAAVRHTHIVV